MNYQDTLSKLAAAKDRKEKRELKAKTLWVKGSKPPKKIPKAKLRKRLIKELDKEFSLLIRALWPRSPFSGLPSEHCFHFVTRSKYSVRWNELNAVGSTAGENYRYEFDPHFAVAWYIKHYGLTAYEALIAEGNRIVKWGNEDLSIILRDIRIKRMLLMDNKNTPCVNSDGGI